MYLSPRLSSAFSAPLRYLGFLAHHLYLAALTAARRPLAELLKLTRSKAPTGTAHTSGLDQPLIDDSISKRKPPVIRNNKLLTHSLRELHHTERKYVSDMRLIGVYRTRLERCNDLSVNEVIPSVSVNLLSFGEELLSAIKGDGDGADEIEPAAVARAFASIHPFLKAYSDYSAEYKRCLANLTAARKRPSVKKALIELQQQHGQQLEDMLIKPVQRLCKYPLLLREIATALGDGDGEERAQIERALQAVTEEVSEVNSKVAGAERARGLREVEHELGLACGELGASSTRRWLHTSDVQLLGESNGRGSRELATRRLYVLSDLLLIAEPRKRSRYSLNSLSGRRRSSSCLWSEVRYGEERLALSAITASLAGGGGDDGAATVVLEGTPLPRALAFRHVSPRGGADGGARGAGGGTGDRAGDRSPCAESASPSEARAFVEVVQRAREENRAAEAGVARREVRAGRAAKQAYSFKRALATSTLGEPTRALTANARSTDGSLNGQQALPSFTRRKLKRTSAVSAFVLPSDQGSPSRGRQNAPPPARAGTPPPGNSTPPHSSAAAAPGPSVPVATPVVVPFATPVSRDAPLPSSVPTATPVVVPEAIRSRHHVVTAIATPALRV